MVQLKGVSDAVLTWLLVISVGIIIANNFIFETVAEIVLFGDELGNIMSNLSLAYISSFIFYYIVVVRKEYQDKVRIYKTVTNLCSQLTGRAFSVYDMIVAGSNAERTLHSRHTVTKEQFVDMCKLCNQNNIHPNRGIQMEPLYPARRRHRETQRKERIKRLKD